MSIDQANYNTLLPEPPLSPIDSELQFAVSLLNLARERGEDLTPYKRRIIRRFIQISKKGGHRHALALQCWGSSVVERPVGGDRE